MNFKIIIRAQVFNKETRQPWSSDGSVVKLYDQDLMEDDFLGECKIGEYGQVEISFNSSDFKSMDSPGEKYPDIYLCIYKYGKLLFKSEVRKNLNFEKEAELKEGVYYLNLGVFNI
ncbi:MAG: hypothetical protein K2X86_16660 [Cytophagaceae bacterium]|nr:hypothetical protein [Cytophagaceae bacterium]